jgi:hypothetical protein
MKSLKSILEASILADIDDQLESGDEAVQKFVITKWIKNNVLLTQDNKLKFNFNTEPITVDCDSNIYFSPKITSLTDGTFKWGKVKGYFYCSECKLLKSLEGAPEKVEGDFECSKCESLKTLKGAPKEVGKDFDCRECGSLESLEGAPKEVGKDFWCNNCSIKFTENDVRNESKVKGRIMT